MKKILSGISKGAADWWASTFTKITREFPGGAGIALAVLAGLLTLTGYAAIIAAMLGLAILVAAALLLLWSWAVVSVVELLVPALTVTYYQAAAVVLAIGLLKRNLAKEASATSAVDQLAYPIALVAIAQVAKALLVTFGV